jgi:hypothetical protein
MWRWCFTAVALCSHAMLIAVCVFWFRSYWVRDDLALVIIGSGSWTLQSESGRLSLSSAPDDMTSANDPTNGDVDIAFDAAELETLYEMSNISSPDFYDHHSFAGFEYGSYHDTWMSYDTWILIVPFWFIACSFSVLPGWWLLSFRRRYLAMKWALARVCSKCGYDPKTAQQKCPECGGPVGAL